MVRGDPVQGAGSLLRPDRQLPRRAEPLDEGRPDLGISGRDAAEKMALHLLPADADEALVGMARSCGYDPCLIDPREAFGSAARFAGETVRHDWPDKAMAALGLDQRTAVVTLTHDPKLDDPAIQAALRSDCFYLGCLGSTRTHARRVARLAEAGFTEAEIARIHAPVGLDIGAKSPAEIALSIMAEITQVLRRG